MKADAKKVQWGDRYGELKVQIDRWPLTADEPTCYVLTIVCMAMYAGKPDSQTIRKTLQDAIAMVPDEQPAKRITREQVLGGLKKLSEDGKL